MIHFGFSERAKASASSVRPITAPRRAPMPRVRCRRPRDPAEGPNGSTPHARGRARRAPQERGIAAGSRSAGRYLCNFLYYLSLDWARRQRRRSRPLRAHPALSGTGGPFSKERALARRAEILRFVLAFAERQGAAGSKDPASSGSAFARN